MPDTLELPRMLRAVVPLMSGQRGRGRVVDETVALAHGEPLRRFLDTAAGRVPGFAAVVGHLDDLPKPAARLRNVNAVGIHRRALHVVDLPSGEERAAHIPLLAFSVGGQNERSFARSGQYANFAHNCPFSFLGSGPHATSASKYSPSTVCRSDP